MQIFSFFFRTSKNINLYPLVGRKKKVFTTKYLSREKKNYNREEQQQYNNNNNNNNGRKDLEIS